MMPVPFLFIFVRGLKFMLDCVLKGWASRRPSKTASIDGLHSAVSRSPVTSGLAELCDHYFDRNALSFPPKPNLTLTSSAISLKEASPFSAKKNEPEGAFSMARTKRSTRSPMNTLE